MTTVSDARIKELCMLMINRFSMNPISCTILNSEWKQSFPNEVAVAKVMVDLLKRATKIEVESNPVWVEAEIFETIQAILNREMSSAGRYVSFSRHQLPGNFKQRKPIYISPPVDVVPALNPYATDDDAEVHSYNCGWNECVAEILKRMGKVENENNA